MEAHTSSSMNHRLSSPSPMETECRECGSDDIVEDYAAGDLICRGCGIVLAERLIDETAEWNNYAEDDRDRGNQSRIGEAVDSRMGETTLQTFLVKSASHSETAAPKYLNAAPTTTSMRRHEGVEQIKTLAHALNVGAPVVDCAITIYARVDEENLFAHKKFNERNGVFAAILFMACRECSHSRTLKELSVASGVDIKRIGKSLGVMSRTSIASKKQAGTEDFLSRFCSSLDLPSKTPILALQVVEKAAKMGLVDGKAPAAVAAAVIYMVAAYTNVKRSLDEVAEASLVGKKVVKDVCKVLHENKSLFDDLNQVLV
ncbi:hypothetical protein DYB37_004056 [Aphanomyces astaci]|uniref:General transcription factor TFIIB n=2 Tax=Aphanomyces astaci TaxID=112090 RepID=A0A397B4R3_APHAT|nr:hypothetical protein DYB36_002852 [Aphanomyces astaci]RHY70271.1 hypothetical protein DYB38_003732 [Aphanomyces astaci]RHY92726.1 hypothetical protein DYB35_006501 [Aphanomyces astaci]RHZ08351.1 hypothetical protein DYB37_004056 [Aphanomyces astaci]RHZ11730.1 hypothetical protein DYB26_008232 [Aphanomyces astaci]